MILEVRPPASSLGISKGWINTRQVIERGLYFSRPFTGASEAEIFWLRFKFTASLVFQT